MTHTWSGPTDPSAGSGYGDDAEHPARKGFFTDTSICIGCKACEVACKEWNDVPSDHFEMLGSSYDNSHSLNANQWRHVAFIEQPGKRLGNQDSGLRQTLPTSTAATIPADLVAQAPAVPAVPAVHLGMPGFGASPDLDPRDENGEEKTDFRWLMSSDVCKHCTNAACLDVCPTGSLFRTEFGTVVVQDDICNGCGYCIPACPYGVIERRAEPEGQSSHGVKNVGIAQKCTLCYDRLDAGQTPACAQACPTQSIQFGDVEELRERANTRVEALHEAGIMDARLYGNDPEDGVGGAGAFFLLLDEPEVYGFPPDPIATTKDLPAMYKHAVAAAGVLLAGVAVSFGGSLLGRRR